MADQFSEESETLAERGQRAILKSRGCLLMFTISELQQRIEQLTRQVNAPTNMMPTYDNSKNDGTPNIEVDDASITTSPLIETQKA